MEAWGGVGGGALDPLPSMLSMEPYEAPSKSCSHGSRGDRRKKKRKRKKEKMGPLRQHAGSALALNNLTLSTLSDGIQLF